MSTTPSEQRPIRVVVIDDDLFVRETLSVYLSAVPDIDLVGSCADGVDALDTVRRTDPQVVLMDLRMRIMDGPSATRELAREFPEVQVIALTSFGDDDDLREMFEAGAHGFLLKSTRPAALANAIRAAHSGVTVVPRDLVERWRAPRPTTPKPILEPREWALLECLELGLTNRAIAQRIFISPSSVKAQLSSLMRKLDASTRTHVVARAHALGLLPRQQEPGPRPG